MLTLLVLLSTMALSHAVEEVDQFEEYVDYEEYEERYVYQGFPLGIVCADVSDVSDVTDVSDVSVLFPSYGNYLKVALIEQAQARGDEEYTSVENPGDVIGIPTMSTLTEETRVQCTIRRDDEVVYNESMIWGDRFIRGVFDYADEKWDDANFTISVSWGDGEHIVGDLTTKLNPIAGHVCSKATYVATEFITRDVGDNIYLECKFGTPYMSEEQYNSLSVTWWQGCDKIKQNDSNYEINLNTYNSSSQNGREFASLTIKNVSLQTTPGAYHCTLERNTPTGKLEVVPKSYAICLQKPYSPSNVPTITLSAEQFSVAPGSDLEMVAFGSIGKGPTLSLSVLWKRWDSQLGNWKMVCEANTEGTDRNCTLFRNKNMEYCEPLRPSEIEDIANYKAEDNFTSTYILRSATEEHEGLYQVQLVTTSNSESKNFTVKVQYPPAHPRELVITLSVAGVFVLIALVILLLLHIYSLKIRYLKKKLFEPEIFDSRPMAYLLYYPDASDDGDPVQVVRKFIAGRRYYDANNMNGTPEHNPAGRPIGDYVIDLLRESMSLVIFVTPDMLKENEIEIFAAYRGFEENIQNELPIVFITTPEARNIIKGTKSEDNLTIATFRDFMKRGRNRVIQWDERHPKRFRQALYAFLPKVVSHVETHKEPVV